MPDCQRTVQHGPLGHLTLWDQQMEASTPLRPQVPGLTDHVGESISREWTLRPSSQRKVCTGSRIDDRSCDVDVQLKLRRPGDVGAGRDTAKQQRSPWFPHGRALRALRVACRHSVQAWTKHVS